MDKIEESVYWEQKDNEMILSICNAFADGLATSTN
jgi:hypothetical protein